MPSKQPMQDMIPPEKRTIRRIPLGNSSRPSKIPNREPELEENHGEGGIPHQTFSDIPPSRVGSKKIDNSHKKWWTRIVIALVIVIVISFLIFSLFSRAVITVTSQQEDITISGTFAAGTEAEIDVLEYELFTLTRESTEVIKATGEKFVEAKSSGTIIIFNDFGTTEQRLVANTRFQTSNGLVYRIQDPVVVPGQTTNSKGETIPGSLEVRVVADKPGEEYNVEMSDFKLPGLEESGDIE